MSASNDPHSSSTPSILSILHPDIIQTQILTRLDGPSLASTSCASAQLKHLASDPNLWRNISISTWPSLSHPKLQSLISSFPHQHQSFFSHSFPQLKYSPAVTSFQRNLARPVSDQLVSAVDLFYKGKPIFTRVVETDCNSVWFNTSPFRVNTLEISKQSVTVPIVHSGSVDSAFINQLEQNLTLSWILIDPKWSKSVNLSSFRPVSVRRQWTTGDVKARFATVLRNMEEETEILCSVTVTYGEKQWKDGSWEEVDVKEVSMHLEDMDGKTLSGESSLAVLAAALEFGERRLMKREEVKETYEAYLERRRERRRVKDRREWLLDLVFTAASVAAFLSFWGFVLY